MKEKIKSLMKDEGYMMVSVFLILVVLIVMGSVISKISLSEYKNAERNKCQTILYYQARSGAELTAKAILNGDLAMTVNEYNVKENEKLISEINIMKEDVSDPNNKNYVIKSTATMPEKNLKETIYLTLEKNWLFDHAAYTYNGLNIHAGEVDGDLATAITESKAYVNPNSVSGTIEYEINKPLNKFYPSLKEEEKEIKEDILIDDGSKMIGTINGNNSTFKIPGVYSSIKVESGILEFRITSDENIEIVVDKFKVETTGRIEITKVGDAKGKVIIYTNNMKGETEAGANVVDNKTGDPNKFLIMNNFNKDLEEGDEIKIETAGDFAGGIYAPLSKVTMETGGTVTGAIIADDLKMENADTKLIYSLIDDYSLSGDNLGYYIGKWSDRND